MRDTKECRLPGDPGPMDMQWEVIPMRNYFAGYSARYWNRMFHEAYEGRKGYRTAAQVEAVVIAALVAIILCLVRR